MTASFCWRFLTCQAVGVERAQGVVDEHAPESQHPQPVQRMDARRAGTRRDRRHPGTGAGAVVDSDIRRDILDQVIFGG